MNLLKKLFGGSQKNTTTDKIFYEDPFMAAQHGKTDILDKLIQDGLDIQLTSKDGGSLLHYASQNLHYSTASLLIKLGLDPKLKANNGNTPSDWARMSNEIRMGAPSERVKAYINWLEEHNNETNKTA